MPYMPAFFFYIDKNDTPKLIHAKTCAVCGNPEPEHKKSNSGCDKPEH